MYSSPLNRNTDRYYDKAGRMTRITRLEVMTQPSDLPEILDLFKSTPESQAGRDKPDADR